MEKMKQKKTIFTILSVVLMVSCAFGVYTRYDSMEQMVDKSDRLENNIYYYLEDYLPFSLYHLKAEANGIDAENQNTYVEGHNKLKVSLGNIDPKFSAEDEEKVKKEITAEMVSRLESQTQALRNDKAIDYWVKDNQSGKEFATNENLVNYDKDKNLQKYYKMFIEVQYDKNGVSVSKTYPKTLPNYMFDENQMILSHHFGSTWYDDDSNFICNFEATMNAPTNMHYIFGIKDKEEYFGPVVYLYENNTIDWYFPYSVPYMLMIAGVAALFMLFAPIRIVKECQPYKLLKECKTEILIFLGGWIGACILFGIVSMIALTSSGTLSKVIADIGLSDLSNFLLVLINVAVWSAGIWFVMFTIFMVKYIFHKGLIRYLKENTCVGWLFKVLKKGFNEVTTFDLKDKKNRILLTMVGINFLIPVLLSIVFGFGWLSFLVYSIALFIFLRNRYEKIELDYGKLLQSTKKLSEGDFNIKIDEDLGIFNSLRDEFGHIRDGFETAVNEEVKSQRMKTELISNVSHDLKTPLTSIITYVDLLKKEGITEEERSSYVETLDRNALRLKNLIEDLFEVSKANSGNVSLNIMDVDVVSLIRQAQFECLDKIEEMGLQFKMNFSSDKMIYPLDSSKTYRIFENLLMNICKYAMPNTRVYVNAEESDHEVSVVFKNISANEIDFDGDEIVERFVQGDKSRNTGGSGLGLAIAKSFIELQGGSFKVEVDGDLFKAIVTFVK